MNFFFKKKVKDQHQHEMRSENKSLLYERCWKTLIKFYFYISVEKHTSLTPKMLPRTTANVLPFESNNTRLFQAVKLQQWNLNKTLVTLLQTWEASFFFAWQWSLWEESSHTLQLPKFNTECITNRQELLLRISQAETSLRCCVQLLPGGINIKSSHPESLSFICTGVEI
jgi:hypothetical protein